MGKGYFQCIKGSQTANLVSKWSARVSIPVVSGQKVAPEYATLCHPIHWSESHWIFTWTDSRFHRSWLIWLANIWPFWSWRNHRSSRAMGWIKWLTYNRSSQLFQAPFHRFHSPWPGKIQVFPNLPNKSRSPSISQYFNVPTGWSIRVGEAAPCLAASKLRRQRRRRVFVTWRDVRLGDDIGKVVRILF